MGALGIRIGCGTTGIESTPGSARIIRDNGRLRLGEMLRRHGSTAEQALDGGYQSAIAVRRCMMCAQKAECDQWLPSGAKLGMEAFCPNAGFIGRIATSR